jgi:hypothetical protein
MPARAGRGCSAKTCKRIGETRSLHRVAIGGDAAPRVGTTTTTTITTTTTMMA